MDNMQWPDNNKVANQHNFREEIDGLQATMNYELKNYHGSLVLSIFSENKDELIDPIIDKLSLSDLRKIGFGIDDIFKVCTRFYVEGNNAQAKRWHEFFKISHADYLASDVCKLIHKGDIFEGKASILNAIIPQLDGKLTEANGT